MNRNKIILLTIICIIVVFLGLYLGLHNKNVSNNKEDIKNTEKQDDNENYGVYRSLSCLKKHISDEDDEALELYYKADHKISADYAYLLNDVDFSLTTKYYCFQDACSSKEEDLYDYYKEEYPDSNKTSDFSNYVFEIKDGIVNVKTENKTIKYDKVSNVISLKAIFNVEFGPTIVFLDKSGNLHYIELNDTSLTNHQLLSSNIMDFSVFSGKVIRDIEPAVSYGNYIAVNTEDGKTLFSNLYNSNGKKYNFKNINDVKYYSIYSSETSNDDSFDVFIEYSPNLNRTFIKDNHEFEKYNGKELVLKYFIMYDYILYLINSDDEIIYIDLKDCNGTYTKYKDIKVKNIENNSVSKKVIITYVDNKTEELAYDYFFN